MGISSGRLYTIFDLNKSGSAERDVQNSRYLPIYLIYIPESPIIYTTRQPDSIQGESKKTDTFDIQMNNKGVSFF